MTSDDPLAPFIAEIERCGRVLRVLADYGSSGLCDGRGCERAAEEFGLPADIEAALDVWDDQYRAICNRYDPGGCAARRLAAI